MKRLNRVALETSRRFVESEGRPLEVARFHHAFNGAPVEDVLAALSNFQNMDGGFGHALEPDLRAPESSALCTSIAFQIFRSLKTPPDHPLVNRGIDFFLKQLDQKQAGWRIIPESAENSPRAPWWYQKEHIEKFEAFSLNPTAEILGYLYDYQGQVPGEIITLVSNRVVSEIDCLDAIGMHELLCCLRLLKTMALPQDLGAQVHTALKAWLSNTIICDPDEWKGYCLRPLQVVDCPESPFIDGFEDAVSANLNYEIKSRNENGSWTPTWSWDESFPESWAKAKREWSGIITIKKLLVLKSFGRIAEYA